MKNNQKLTTSERIKLFFNTILTFAGFGAIIFFIYCLPYIWWEVTWKELFAIATNKTNSIEIINTITKITESLGITSNNLHSWAVERMFICIAIGIGLIITILIISYLLKLKIKKQKN